MKFNIQKKYIVFFTVVPLLFASAAMKVPCPVCHGTGEVVSTGMDGVKCSNVQYKELSSFSAACDQFRNYQYEVSVDVTNTSPTLNADGWLVFYLINQGNGMAVSYQYGKCELEPSQAASSIYYVSFQIRETIDTANMTYVQCKPLITNNPDTACDGTGWIPLNELLLKNAYKDNFVSQSTQTRPYTPIIIMTEGGPELIFQ